MKVQSIPTVYRGIRFASTLEADTAATFDHFGWAWSYEPVGLIVDGRHWYRPDFWLGAQRVWVEVKGPHNERIEKPRELQRSLPGDEWEEDAHLVVVIRPPLPSEYGTGETLQWEGTQPGQDIVMTRCPHCLHYGFMDLNGAWFCRRHPNIKPEPNKFWTADGGGLYRPGDLPFTRAPREDRGPQRLGEFTNQLHMGRK